MKIEHLAMYVRDLDGAKEFFEKYFNAKAGELYHNKTSNFRSYFLSFDDDTSLEIMTSPDIIDQKKDQKRTGFAHLAFSLGSKSKVNELTKRLENNSYQVISGPRVTGDGYYESAILAFEENIIELTI